MFRRMIRRSFTVRRLILIRLITIRAMRPGWDWPSARDSYWEQPGQTIGAIVIGATATSPLTTRTTSIETTLTISIEGSGAENGNITRSIEAAHPTEIAERLTSTAGERVKSPPAELARVRQRLEILPQAGLVAHPVSVQVIVPAEEAVEEDRAASIPVVPAEEISVAAIDQVVARGFRLDQAEAAR